MDSKQWESLYKFEIEDVSFRKLVRKVMAKIPRADAREFSLFCVVQGSLAEDTLGHGSENVTLDVAKMNALGLSEDDKIAVTG